MANVVLSVQDVTIRYGDFVAVDALCLEVKAGEVFGLLGPNGSGKSSTLSAIAGALTPATGTIAVAGRHERDDPLAYRRNVGLVPQELALFEELTVEDNLLFFGRLYGLRGRELRAHVVDALRFVYLAEQARQRARTLSGGMQRRLNLACALLHEPALLLLDEPTVGLDVQSRAAIFDSLRALRDQGRALVFTTHHLEEAEQLCDRVAIVDRGRLLALGTPGELCADFADEGPWGPAEATAGLERVFRALTGRSGCEA